MGGGASVEVVSAISTVTVAAATTAKVAMQSLSKSYEQNKHLPDEELLAVLQEEGRKLNAAKRAAVDVDKCNKLLYACGKFHKGSSKGNLPRAQALATDPAVDVNFVDEDGWSALFHAAGEGHLKTCEFLLSDSCKATVDLQDPYSCTPLWVAAYNNRRDCVKALLLAGADDKISGQPEGEPSQTPSLAARRNRHPGLADYIDGESQLRKKDPERRQVQVRREMSLGEFNASLRSLLDKSGEQGVSSEVAA